MYIYNLISLSKSLSKYKKNNRVGWGGEGGGKKAAF
jgi:hypothetical protein